MTAPSPSSAPGSSTSGASCAVRRATWRWDRASSTTTSTRAPSTSTGWWRVSGSSSTAGSSFTVMVSPVADDPIGLVGHVLDGQFRVDAYVGEGGFSVVYKG